MLAKTPAPKPTPKRVSNSLGLLLADEGLPSAMVIHRPDLRRLAEVRDLWTGARQYAVRVVLGVVELTEKDGEYRVTIVSCREGYDKMLLEIASGISSLMGAKNLDFVGRKVRPRPWGPFDGMRRRGYKELRRLAKHRDLDGEDTATLVRTLRQAFLAQHGNRPAPAPGDPQ